MAGSYGQFCPVSKAAEVLCERWTPLIVRELIVGSTRFNEIRRGVPSCSPALLSQRLKSLERAGVVTHSDAGYALTQAGWELFPLIQALGEWGQRWARSTYTEDELDPALLLWDVRRYLRPTLGVGRVVLHIRFPAAPERRRSFWLVTGEESVDVCLTDPGWPHDVLVEADLRALTKVWMGDISFREAMRTGDVRLDGPAGLVRQIPDWFGQHPVLAKVPAAQ